MLMPNKQTKYCTPCRLGRAAAWSDERQITECSTCERKFIAWGGVNAKGGPKTCGYCFLLKAPAGGRDAVRGTCQYGTCDHTSDLIVHKDLALCYPCLYNPDNLDTLKRRLSMKRADRVAHRH